MPKSTSKNRPRALREQAARYVVGASGQPVAVLLTLEEYDRYLDLLDDQADSHDPKLAARLARAAARPPTTIPAASAFGSLAGIWANLTDDDLAHAQRTIAKGRRRSSRKVKQLTQQLARGQRRG